MDTILGVLSVSAVAAASSAFAGAVFAVIAAYVSRERRPEIRDRTFTENLQHLLLSEAELRRRIAEAQKQARTRHTGERPVAGRV
jgi:malonyl CoA-acyl carrier protein transacylase